MRVAFSSAPTPIFLGLQLGRGSWEKGHPREFSPKIDSEDLSHIQFILKNLANKSLIGLLKLKKELKKRGEKVDHVHPLTFFIGVLSPSCVQYFYELKARKGLPYSEFVKGAIESFHDERKHNNLTLEQISLFAKMTKRNEKQIRAFIEAKDYSGLIQWL